MPVNFLVLSVSLILLSDLFARSLPILAHMGKLLKYPNLRANHYVDK